MDGGHSDIERYAIDNNVPIMHAEGILFLINMILKYQVRSILELGSGIGYSAICMAEVNSEIRVKTIEKDEERYHEAVRNISNKALSNQITCLNIDAYDFMTAEKYDLIFLDAAKAQYQGLFNRFVNNLHQNGFFIVDNLMFHGMVDDPSLTRNRRTKDLVRKLKKFRDNILSNSLYDVAYYPEVGDGVALIRVK
ncbi:MAG: O-methyltransferase [Erysipelotrichaceae bacterium]|nr:O-methyltransferase [Erysipelotrichaceae bacterium]